MRKLLPLALGLLLLSDPATATTYTLNILDGGGTSRATAWGKDASSYYFALGGIYGINGDYQADVAADNGLLVDAAGTVVGGFSFPAACASAVGFLGYLSCEITLLQTAIPAGTNNIGKVELLNAAGTAIDIAGGTNSATAVPVQAVSGGIAFATTPGTNASTWRGSTGVSSGTGAATFTSALAANYTYVTDLECGRTDAGTTGIAYTLNDGAATVIVIPNSGGGGGWAHTFSVPLKVSSGTDTALTITPATTGTTYYCSAQGFFLGS
jgi:hypothetical protein